MKGIQIDCFDCHNRLAKLPLFPKSRTSDSDDTVDTGNVRKLALIQSLIILWAYFAKKKMCKNLQNC
jgi:hypothetical protein